MTIDHDDKTPPRPETPAVTAYRLAQAEKRLNEGAGAFADLRNQIAKVDARGVRLIGGLFATALGVAVAVGVLLNRVDDTASTQEKHEKKLEAVSEDLTAIKGEQIRLRDSVDDLGRTIEEKLDKAIDPPEDPLTKRRRPR